jgi:hypothetical protein
MADESPGVRIRAKAAAWRQVDDETVVLQLETSTYLGVNRTGTILWPAMVEGTSRDQLIERLIAECGIERERAETDVDAFVAACQSRGLLEP